MGAALLAGLAGCGGGGGGSLRPGGGPGGGDVPPIGDGPDGEDAPPAGGSPGGGDATPAPPLTPGPVFSVANPYALANAKVATDVKVDSTRVFGDSYSQTDRNGITDWATVFHHQQGMTSDLDNYAVGGATARGSADNNSFARQVGRFTEDGGTIGDRDLTILYLGYNDVNSGANLKATSEVDFAANADALRLDHGATTGERRMFVTLLHDWSRNPHPGAATIERVVDWNDFLVSYANGHDNIVAVDLFTVFNRILDGPDAVGFTNVTTADPDNAGSTALFSDGNHFGARGQRIIAEVYRHYLTRGWDWSNTLAAGSNATKQLNKDIDNQALVFSYQLRMAEEPFRLSAFPVGSPPAQEAAGENAARVGFAEAAAGDVAGGGVGLNYALRRDTALGVVVGRYGALYGNENGLTLSQASVDSDVVSFYLDNDWRGLALQTRASYARDTHVRRAYDSLVDRGDHAAFGGATWSVRQRLGYPVRAGGSWYTPWLDLSHLVQKVEGFTIASPYVSDTTYSPAEASETLATLGLNVQPDPLELGHRTRLTLNGGVSYTRSLRRDDYEVEIREAALPGYVQKEVIPRPEVERVGLQLGGNLQVGEGLTVRGGYGWLRDQQAAGEHDLRMDFTYRF